MPIYCGVTMPATGTSFALHTRDTYACLQVTQVERIENPAQWAAYCGTREKIRSRHTYGSNTSHALAVQHLLVPNARTPVYVS